MTVETSTKQAEIPLPPLELCLELVELYFDLIHDQFHSLFHRPSFIEQVKKGTAPPVLLFAMMALSARFESTKSLCPASANTSQVLVKYSILKDCPTGSVYAVL
jgi:hypothetical protein